MDTQQRNKSVVRLAIVMTIWLFMAPDGKLTDRFFFSSSWCNHRSMHICIYYLAILLWPSLYPIAYISGGGVFHHVTSFYCSFRPWFLATRTASQRKTVTRKCDARQLFLPFESRENPLILIFFLFFFYFLLSSQPFISIQFRCKGFHSFSTMAFLPCTLFCNTYIQYV